MGKPKPLWMPLYINQFLADTTSLTPVQGWAYVNLLAAMWRSEDGTLLNDPTTLAKVGKSPRHWKHVWDGIGPLLEIDGDRVTAGWLQAELGKANARIVVKRAAASLGGRTTQFHRSVSGTYAQSVTRPNPLKNNNVVQASAQANYNYNSKKKEEEREVSTRPDTVEPSLKEKKEASREEPVDVSLPNPPHQPEGPSENPLMEALGNWGEALKKRNHGGSGQ